MYILAQKSENEASEVVNRFPQKIETKEALTAGKMEKAENIQEHGTRKLKT